MPIRPAAGGGDVTAPAARRAVLLAPAAEAVQYAMAQRIEVLPAAMAGSYQAVRWIAVLIAAAVPAAVAVPHAVAQRIG